MKDCSLVLGRDWLPSARPIFDWVEGCAFPLGSGHSTSTNVNALQGVLETPTATVSPCTTFLTSSTLACHECHGNISPHALLGQTFRLNSSVSSSTLFWLNISKLFSSSRLSSRVVEGRARDRVGEAFASHHAAGESDEFEDNQQHQWNLENCIASLPAPRCGGITSCNG